ncbi:MAG: MauE/DoxX family redox-associated membrane protein [Luteibaculaceae bacterium]
MNILGSFSRIFVGTLFIVSGLIKANDTVGFSYKLEEYFSADVLNIPFLEPYALAFAVFVCIAEILLGIAALIGARMVLVSWLLLLLNTFFTILTFYSAYFNKVTDCGCFGDAIPFSPWQSFWKDVVLMVFILIIFWFRKRIKLNNLSQNLSFLTISAVLVALFSLMVLKWAFPLIFVLALYGSTIMVLQLMESGYKDWVVAAIGLFLSAGFIKYTQDHLPIKDYRAYAIGKNIGEGMSIPEGAPQPIFSNIFIYKNLITGEEEKFTEDNYPWDNSDYEFVDRKSTLVQKGYEPPVKDFVFYNEDGDEVSYYFSEGEDYVFLIVAHTLNKANTKGFTKINQLAYNAMQDGIYSYVATATGWDEIAKFAEVNKVPSDFLVADETMLKTIIRSNPGLVLIKNGTVLGKWHHNDIPEYADLKGKLIQ